MHGRASQGPQPSSSPSPSTSGPRLSHWCSVPLVPPSSQCLRIRSAGSFTSKVDDVPNPSVPPVEPLYEQCPRVGRGGIGLPVGAGYAPDVLPLTILGRFTVVGWQWAWLPLKPQYALQLFLAEGAVRLACWDWLVGAICPDLFMAPGPHLRSPSPARVCNHRPPPPQSHCSLDPY